MNQVRKAARDAAWLVSNTLVAVLACVLIWVLLIQHGQRPGVADGVKIGSKLQPIAGVDWRAHEMTLLVFIRRGCHYCEDSMPFYKELGRTNSRAKRVFVVCLAPDNTEDARHLLESNDVSLPVIGEVDLTSVNVTGTPTLILVDKSGTVIRSWIGRLNSGLETEVKGILRGSVNPNGARSPWFRIWGG